MDCTWTYVTGIMALYGNNNWNFLFNEIECIIAMYFVNECQAEYICVVMFGDV